MPVCVWQQAFVQMTIEPPRPTVFDSRSVPSLAACPWKNVRGSVPSLVRGRLQLHVLTTILPRVCCVCVCVCVCVFVCGATQEYDAFLRDKTRLAAVREQMASGAATEAQLKVHTHTHTLIPPLALRARPLAAERGRLRAYVNSPCIGSPPGAADHGEDVRVLHHGERGGGAHRGRADGAGGGAAVAPQHHGPGVRLRMDWYWVRRISVWSRWDVWRWVAQSSSPVGCVCHLKRTREFSPPDKQTPSSNKGASHHHAHSYPFALVLQGRYLARPSSRIRDSLGLPEERVTMPSSLQGKCRAGERVRTPSRIALSVGHHQLPQASSTY
jgi:hypothetical protein